MTRATRRHVLYQSKTSSTMTKIGHVIIALYPTIITPYDEESCCQEIGLVALMFFFELLFLYVPSSISFYVSLTNLFSIISFPYLLITRDTQDEGEA